MASASLGEVFGTSKVATAKAKYRKGRQWLRRLDDRDKIVTDRSGYSDEVFLGGLTGFHWQIALSPENIDKLDDHESIVTLVHESMHAGNSDVDDHGYIGQPSFTELPEAVKLTNAAHFEVVPRRILGAADAFVGITFVPAGATVGGVTAPPMTDVEQAIRGASEHLRTAWTIGLNLHKLFVNAYKEPAAWTHNQGGGKTFAHGLPFWSKVEQLTVHHKTEIDPASSDVAKHPISLIDVALSEGLVRKLAIAMVSVPHTEADASTFEDAHSTEAEQAAAHVSVDAHRDFLVRLVLAKPSIAPITGTVDRDVRVVSELVNLNWGTVLDQRSPDDFAD